MFTVRVSPMSQTLTWWKVRRDFQEKAWKSKCEVPWPFVSPALVDVVETVTRLPGIR